MIVGIDFSIEQKENVFIFTNKSTMDLVIEKLPVPPKRKRTPLLVITKRSFLIIPCTKFGEIDLSKISIRIKKRENEEFWLGMQQRGEK